MNENIGRLKSPYVFLIRSSFFQDLGSLLKDKSRTFQQVTFSTAHTQR